MIFYTPENMTTKALFPGCRARLIHTERMTISIVTLDAGAVLPEHAHEHEQVSNVIKGEFEFTIGGHTQILKPGEVAVIPSHVPHTGKALTDCCVIDVFSPVREDYR
ncbi:MAG: cupin domain-containing protein [Desulfobacterales bacterium]